MPRRPAPGRVPGSATPRPRVGAAALTVAALALAACAGTPGTAAGDAPAGAARTALTAQQFAAEQIPLPPQATTLQEAAEVVAVAEPRGAFPALIAAATQTADRPAGVRLWHGDVQGERFYALDAVPQVDGDVTTVCADQDARHAVVAGGWWDGSALHPFLWRADESGTWTDVPLVDDVARGIVRAVAVDSGRAWAVVELPDRADALLTVDLASGSSSAVPLPVTASGAERRITGVAAQGGTVVILAEEGPPEALLRPVGYVSADAGATISGPHAIGEGRAGDSAVGIVEAAGEFVVAGGAGATPAEARRTLWRSPDGLTWRPEAVVLPKSLAPDVLPTDWLTSVTSDPDGALSVGLSGGTFAAGVNLADGSYLAGETDAVDSTALALRVGPDPQDSVLLFWAEGGIAEYFFTSDGQVLDQTVVHTTRRTRIMVPDRSDGSRLLASRDALREVDGVRVQSPMDTDLVRRGGEIALADWRPEEAAGWSDLRLGTSDGRTVLAGTARTGGGWRVGALVSDDDDTGWTPADGVTTGDDALPTALGHADGAWYLAASVGDLDLDNHLFAPEVWTSRDGSTWEPLGDAFPVDGDDAEVYAFCSAPDGGALAVGTTLAPDGTWAPSVWRGEGDRWRTTVLSEGGEGWIDGCQDGGAEVILTGEQAGLTRTWRVAGDAGPVEAQTLAPDEIRGAPLSLAVAGGPGGWVAGGYLDTPEHVGAVLWFSSDGERWDWVALPGRALSTAPEVALDGTDLLVFGDVGHSPVAWVVRGLVDAG